MAVTATLYNKFKQANLEGNGVDLSDGNVKVTLHTSSYSPDLDADEFFDDTTNEASNGSGYTTGGETIGTPTVSLNTGSDFAYMDGDDVVWTTLTKTFRYAVVRYNTGVAGTSRLLWLINFGADQSPAGVNFTIEWAAAGSGGLLKLA